MTPLLFSPDKNLFMLLSVIALLAFPASIFNENSLWWLICSIAITVALLDLIFGYFSHPLSVERVMSQSLPLGIWSGVTLSVKNSSQRSTKIELFDHLPASMSFQNLPARLSIPAGKVAHVTYQLRPKKRGDHKIPKVQFRRPTFLKLWRYTYTIDLSSDFRVYPNFAAVSQYALLALDNRLGQLGINKQRRRGQGQEFHQLREYRRGDPLQKIDWKATSKLRKLISREYNDERNQEILLVIDCGHRMRTQDGSLSHFDHSLNAALLLSYVALQQGDSVGVSTFSGSRRWMMPARGKSAQQSILNTVYDLQPSTAPPDYSEAARSILIRQKKRALIIFITNIRDEDSSDLENALLLLKKRHLILVASMREQALSDVLNNEIKNFQDAINLAAIHEYLSRRQTAFNKLKASGILSLDVTPDELSVQLVNNYLRIKSSAAL